MSKTCYHHFRQATSSRVRDAVLRHRSQLVGSWASGEFHLCKYNGGSLSDVDIVSTAPPDERVAIRHAVETHLHPFKVAKISIHPPASFLGLTLQDGYVLNLSEYVHAQHSATGSEARSYHRAKLALRLCRLSDSESLSETACRIGSAVSICALQVKLGVRCGFSADEAEELLTSQPDLAPSLRSLAFRVLRGVTGEAVAEVALGLDRCPSLPRWLRTHQRAKLSSVIPLQPSWAS